MRKLEEYERPIMEVVWIENRDIDTITASSGDGDEWEYSGWTTPF